LGVSHSICSSGALGLNGKQYNAHIVPLLSSCWIFLHYARYTEIIGMPMILLVFFLICLGYTFACLPLPTGMVLRKIYEIKFLSIEARLGQPDRDALN
jgi:hypothetical protein